MRLLPEHHNCNLNLPELLSIHWYINSWLFHRLLIISGGVKFAQFIISFPGLSNMSPTSWEGVHLNITNRYSLKCVSWKDWSKIKTEKRMRLEKKKMPSLFKEWKEKMYDLSSSRDRYISAEETDASDYQKVLLFKILPLGLMTTMPFLKNVSTSNATSSQ